MNKIRQEIVPSKESVQRKSIKTETSTKIKSRIEIISKYEHKTLVAIC